MDGRPWTAGVALLAVVIVACHRPRPTYEYEATETYTSTADDLTPRRLPPPEPTEPTDATAPGGDGDAPSESTPATAEPVVVEPTQEPEAAAQPEAPEAPEVTPGRWYKAKQW